MRGLLVFLASLAAVVVLFIVFVLPARRERADLAERILRSRRTDKAAVDAARRLTRALGFPRSGDPADARASALVAEFAPDLAPSSLSEISFTLEWERVPELLEWLAVEPGPAPELTSVTAGDDADHCRIEVRFAPTPPGVTPR